VPSRCCAPSGVPSRVSMPQGWRPSLRVGDHLSGLATISQGWRPSLRVGDHLSGLATISQGWRSFFCCFLSSALWEKLAISVLTLLFASNVINPSYSGFNLLQFVAFFSNLQKSASFISNF